MTAEYIWHLILTICLCRSIPVQAGFKLGVRSSGGQSNYRSICKNGNRLFVIIDADTVGNPVRLYYTDNYQNGWTQVPDFPDSAIGNLILAGNILYAAGINYVHDTTIYRSIDNGITWSRCSAPRGPIFFDLEYYNSKLYCAASSGVYQSNDSGASWQLLGDSLLISSVAAVGNSLYGASYDGFYKYDSLLNSWESFEMPACEAGIVLMPFGNKLFAATQGGSVYYEDSAIMTAAINETYKSQFMLYPNPTRGECNAVFTPLSPASKSELDIVDMCGSTLKSMPVSAGANTLHFNTGDMADGIYFCVLKSDGAIVDVRRLVVGR